ncbi:MAG: hypothetical protein IID44_16650 [Planctomycetes bacterium]|nr:hypothetical protein [Planctomycetota bacterium]
MLTHYLKTALRKAHFEMLPDDGQYYGEIAECHGVYATAASLEACRDELEEVLEEWALALPQETPSPGREAGVFALVAACPPAYSFLRVGRNQRSRLYETSARPTVAAL